MDNHPTQKTENIPHSGERVVQHFDTPLHEAVDEKLIATEVPDTVTEFTVTEFAEITPEESDTPEKSEKKNKKGLLIALSSAAGVALVAGGFFGVKAMTETPTSNGPQENTDETTSEIVDVPVVPEIEDPATQPEGELNISALEIPAGLDAETLGKTLFEDRFTEWNNAAATEETNQRWYDYSGEVEDLADTVAKENSTIFAEALYISNYINEPNLVANKELSEQLNARYLVGYLSTVKNDLSEEPYKTWIDVSSVTELESDGDSRELEVHFLEHDNKDKSGGVITSTIGETPAVANITLVEEAGVAKIASIEINEAN